MAQHQMATTLAGCWDDFMGNVLRQYESLWGDEQVLRLTFMAGATEMARLMAEADCPEQTLILLREVQGTMLAMAAGGMHR